MQLLFGCWWWSFQEVQLSSEVGQLRDEDSVQLSMLRPTSSHSTVGGKGTLGLPCLMSLRTAGIVGCMGWVATWPLLKSFLLPSAFWSGADIGRIWSTQRGIREEESSTFLQGSGVQAFLKNFLNSQARKNWNKQKMSKLRYNHLLFFFSYSHNF